MGDWAKTRVAAWAGAKLGSQPPPHTKEMPAIRTIANWWFMGLGGKCQPLLVMRALGNRNLDDYMVLSYFALNDCCMGGFALCGSFHSEGLRIIQNRVQFEEG